MKYITYFLIVALAIICVESTEVQKCKGNKAPKLEASEVSVSGCAKSKCTLRRGTDATIELKIKPEKDIKNLIQQITAIVLEVPLPFPGVYGTSACDSMYDAEGKNKVGCPLKAGETYIYKTSFRVHEFYPTLNLIVHWALNDGKEDAVCFEIPARIK